MCDTISSGDDWIRLQSKAKKSNQTLGVLLFAQWHQPSLHLSKVFDGLQEDNPTIVLCKADADVVPDLTRMFKADSVPTVVFLQSGKEVSRIEGADVPRVVKAVESMASLYKVPALAGFSDGDSNALENRLKRLVQAHQIMLFMRGSPDAPGCQSSRQIIEYLKEVKAEFDYFDILIDEELQQGLKRFSNCKLFPQLYVGGEFFGSVDVVKALFEDRKLKERLGANLSPAETPAVPLEDRLKSLISQHKVMLFMKGSPDEPRCGFSRTIVQLLSGYQLGDFGHFDILSDNEVRQGLKTFSNWKTYPQLYVNGELLGGLDIIKELHEDGELEEMLSA